MKKLKQWISWYFRPQRRPVYPSSMEKIKKLKKKVKDLEFKVGGLENELMIIMKEHRHLINSLEMRIDTLDEGCGKCMKN
jgi:archaellum component FlaC